MVDDINASVHNGCSIIDSILNCEKYHYCYYYYHLLFIIIKKRHTTDVHDESGKGILQSVTEQDALSDFISTAELANREFTAGKII